MKRSKSELSELREKKKGGGEENGASKYDGVAGNREVG